MQKYIVIYYDIALIMKNTNYNKNITKKLFKREICNNFKHIDEKGKEYKYHCNKSVFSINVYNWSIPLVYKHMVIFENKLII